MATGTTQRGKDVEGYPRVSAAVWEPMGVVGEQWAGACAHDMAATIHVEETGATLVIERDAHLHTVAAALGEARRG